MTTTTLSGFCNSRSAPHKPIGKLPSPGGFSNFTASVITGTANKVTASQILLDPATKMMLERRHREEISSPKFIRTPPNTGKDFADRRVRLSSGFKSPDKNHCATPTKAFGSSGSTGRGDGGLFSPTEGKRTSGAQQKKLLEKQKAAIAVQNAKIQKAKKNPLVPEEKMPSVKTKSTPMSADKAQKVDPDKEALRKQIIKVLNLGDKYDGSFEDLQKIVKKRQDKLAENAAKEVLASRACTKTTILMQQRSPPAKGEKRKPRSSPVTVPVTAQAEVTDAGVTALVAKQVETVARRTKSMHGVAAATGGVKETPPAKKTATTTTMASRRVSVDVLSFFADCENEAIAAAGEVVMEKDLQRQNTQNMVEAMRRKEAAEEEAREDQEFFGVEVEVEETPYTVSLKGTAIPPPPSPPAMSPTRTQRTQSAPRSPAVGQSSATGIPPPPLLPAPPAVSPIANRGSSVKHAVVEEDKAPTALREKPPAPPRRKSTVSFKAEGGGKEGAAKEGAATEVSAGERQKPPPPPRRNSHLVARRVSVNAGMSGLFSAPPRGGAPKRTIKLT